MRYYVDKTCIDFSGRMYIEGETVELPEGKHSAHLIPMPEPAEEPAPEAETAETEEPVEEVEEEPAEEPAPAPKKTSRKKAATVEAEG